jgi:hypothetical protein
MHWEIVAFCFGIIFSSNAQKGKNQMKDSIHKMEKKNKELKELRDDREDEDIGTNRGKQKRENKKDKDFKQA